MKQYDEKDIEEMLQNNPIELFNALQYYDKDIYSYFRKKLQKR